jgi:hypothetical protein
MDMNMTGMETSRGQLSMLVQLAQNSKQFQASIKRLLDTGSSPFPC